MESDEEDLYDSANRNISALDYMNLYYPEETVTYGYYTPFGYTTYPGEVIGVNPYIYPQHLNNISDESEDQDDRVVVIEDDEYDEVQNLSTEPVTEPSTNSNLNTTAENKDYSLEENRIYDFRRGEKLYNDEFLENYFNSFILTSCKSEKLNIPYANVVVRGLPIPLHLDKVLTIMECSEIETYTDVNDPENTRTMLITDEDVEVNMILSNYTNTDQYTSRSFINNKMAHYVNDIKNNRETEHDKIISVFGEPKQFIDNYTEILTNNSSIIKPIVIRLNIFPLVTDCQDISNYNNVDLDLISFFEKYKDLIYSPKPVSLHANELQESFQKHGFFRIRKHFFYSYKYLKDQ